MAHNQTIARSNISDACNITACIKWRQIEPGRLSPHSEELLLGFVAGNYLGELAELGKQKWGDRFAMKQVGNRYLVFQLQDRPYVIKSHSMELSALEVLFIEHLLPSIYLAMARYLRLKATKFFQRMIAPCEPLPLTFATYISWQSGAPISACVQNSLSLSS